MTATTTTAAAPRTIEDAIAAEQAARREWEKKTLHRGYTIAELRSTFDRVANPEDWRLPFEATVRSSDVAKVWAAVEFFHGAYPTVVAADDDFGVTIRGEYAAW